MADLQDTAGTADAFDPDSDRKAWLDSFRQSLKDIVNNGIAGPTSAPLGPGLLGDLSWMRTGDDTGFPQPTPSSFQMALAAPLTAAAGSEMPPPMTMSADGDEFLRRREGWHGSGVDSLEGGSRTAFWGHKLQPGEDPQAMDPEETFQADKARAEALVRRAAGATPLSQQQFDGLVSFAYNSPAAFQPGPNNFFYELLSGGNVRGAANRMLLWDRAANANGARGVVPGLTNRRNAERNLILDGDYDEP